MVCRVYRPRRASRPLVGLLSLAHPA